MSNKPCKDCKWVRRDRVFGLFGSYVFAECGAPRAQQLNERLLVDGKPNKTIPCTVHRADSGFDIYCGREGRWWEERGSK